MMRQITSGSDTCYEALMIASDWVGIGLNWLVIREGFSVEMIESPSLPISGDLCPIQKEEARCV